MEPLIRSIVFGLGAALTLSSSAAQADAWITGLGVRYEFGKPQNGSNRLSVALSSALDMSGARIGEFDPNFGTAQAMQVGNIARLDWSRSQAPTIEIAGRQILEMPTASANNSSDEKKSNDSNVVWIVAGVAAVVVGVVVIAQHRFKQGVEQCASNDPKCHQ